ncbi:MAG: DUF1611 domain-containing protein [Lachnospiraceae bacterium]|nr:DUF1611 domain-containing protein [Lachnospiraceae bacterium]
METVLGEDITVCIVDSGYDGRHPLLKETNIVGYELKGSDIVLGECKDVIGHGTAVLGIISKLCPKIRFIMIKIFHETLEVEIKQLVLALSFIHNNIDCQILHLSLGSRFYSDDLYDVCKKITDKNIKIVAAFDNFGGISYPAAFDNVIGVDVSLNCKKNDEFIRIKGSPVNIAAKGGLHRVAWLDAKYMICEGISYSAAYVTAYFVKCMQQYGRDCNIMGILEEHAIKTYCFDEQEREDCFQLNGSVNSAAVCPLNKETMSLVNFADMLPFEVVKIYDSKYGGKVGSRYAAFRDNGKNMPTIENFENIDYSVFDTMILGHVSEMSNLLNRDVKKEILDQCLANKVNVYCFDSYLIEDYRAKFFERGCWIVSADVKVHSSNFNKQGKLYFIQSPVVGIFGTGQRQGKFTLQLLLRKWFQDEGYHVGQLGTEPQSALFQMDEIFPFGYEAQMNLYGEQRIEYLNYLMHRIDRKSVDLIMVGCQSGFVPANYYHVRQYPVHQMEFLLGTLPDVIVLCVNVFDESDYIKRTICAIESLADCRVIALALSKAVPDSFFRKRIVTDDEIEECSVRLQAEIGVPVFKISGDGVSKLGEEIVNYLNGD